ncbi:MAG: DUF3148 domain-containing protein [Synechococcaceae bacterium WB9_2_170]|nr:DUF3148 domain-containing protein [Synechococcaceae bacterium WB9_2_170]
MADELWSRRPRYLKTADPMPMLRPPDLVDSAEPGVVVALRPGDQVAVKFRRGTFLLASADLQAAGGPSTPDQA